MTLIRTLSPEMYDAIMAFNSACTTHEESRVCEDHAHLHDFPHDNFLRMSTKLDSSNPETFFCVKHDGTYKIAVKEEDYEAFFAAALYVYHSLLEREEDQTAFWTFVHQHLYLSDDEKAIKEWWCTRGESVAALNTARSIFIRQQEPDAIQERTKKLMLLNVVLEQEKRFYDSGTPV